MKSFTPTLSQFFRFEILRVLGTAPFHGCDVAEVLEAAEQIRQDDAESWYRAWATAADKAEGSADEYSRVGDYQGACWAFLRACNYRRASEFMLHITPDDPRLLSSVLQASENFRNACKLMDSHVEILEVPYENTFLPAYLFLPTTESSKEAGTYGKTPLLIATGGFDNTQEELYFGMGSGARTRGYACLVFEGPGQGITARRARDKLRMRPDWEIVIAAILNYLGGRADQAPFDTLDLSRIALVGASMGGYFALRGATDPRVSAVISLDGFYDLGEMMASRTPSFLRPESVGDAIFNWVLGIAQRTSFQSRWEFQHAMLATGVKTPADVYRTLGQYTLQGPDGLSILDRVKCPAFVSGARDTLYWTPEQSTLRIFKGLVNLEDGKDKLLWLPAGWGQGSLQAKVGAWSHLHGKMFAWLDGVFGIRRTCD